ncbi:MAG: hypothetical protein H6574_12675 [Lewinellaceae bacterium]|nr:hypothetical protein [Lewinellaceae bacterium]
MAAFFKKYRRDMVYLSVIVGLAGWLGNNTQKQRDTALIEALNFSVRMASENPRMQILYDEITKEAFAYPEEHKSYENKANRIKELANAEHKRLEKYYSRSFTDKLWKSDQLTQDIQTIRDNLRTLADSLFATVDSHLQTKWDIYHSLYSDSAAYSQARWAGLPTGPRRSIRVVAGLQNLMFRIRHAEQVAVQYCHQMVQPAALHDYLFWNPVISAPRMAVKPNELFTADIFFAPVYTNPRNLTFYINDKKVEPSSGIVKYARRYATTGVNKLRVRVEVQNPYTKKTEVYNKSFEVLVAEPCPGEE